MRVIAHQPRGTSGCKPATRVIIDRTERLAADRMAARSAVIADDRACVSRDPLRLGRPASSVRLRYPCPVPEIMLRPAEPADGGVIARVQLAAWRATYGDLNPAMVDGLDLERTTDNWARAAIDLTHRLQLAECDDTTVGYAFSGPADGQADSVGELDAVYLLPSAQGLGVGRLLVEDALSGLAGAGFAECLLWVADQNAHARGFYQHLGFRTDGGRDVWRGLPVVRYRRVLSAASA